MVASLILFIGLTIIVLVIYQISLQNRKSSIDHKSNRLKILLLSLSVYFPTLILGTLILIVFIQLGNVQSWSFSDSLGMDGFLHGILSIMGIAFVFSFLPAIVLLFFIYNYVFNKNLPDNIKQSYSIYGALGACLLIDIIFLLVFHEIFLVLYLLPYNAMAALFSWWMPKKFGFYK